MYGRQAMDSRGRGAREARKPVRRHDRTRLSDAFTTGGARHRDRNHSRRRIGRAELWAGQGALHDTGEGGSAGEKSRDADVGGKEGRRPDRRQDDERTADRGRGEAGAHRRDLGDAGLVSASNRVGEGDRDVSGGARLRQKTKERHAARSRTTSRRRPRKAYSDRIRSWDCARVTFWQPRNRLAPRRCDNPSCSWIRTRRLRSISWLGLPSARTVRRLRATSASPTLRGSTIRFTAWRCKVT